MRRRRLLRAAAIAGVAFRAGKTRTDDPDGGLGEPAAPALSDAEFARQKRRTPEG